MANLINECTIKCILKEYRKKNKLTQGDVANITRIPVKTIGRLERQETKSPSLDVVFLLSSRLGVPIEMLFECKDNILATDSEKV